MNGCETNTTTSRMHCGACMRPCMGAQMCVGGVCTMPDAGMPDTGMPDTGVMDTGTPDVPRDAPDVMDAGMPRDVPRDALDADVMGAPDG
jgi:hypothetical protein